MVEKQVGVEVVVADLQVDLSADERESLAQFQQEPLQVGDQACSKSRSRFTSACPMKSNKYGSRVDCWARSESPGGRVSAKLVTAFPVRSWSRVAM